MSNLKPFIFGALASAVVVPVLGFTTLGWKLDAKAQTMAQAAAIAEVQKVLVPVCMAQFNADPKLAIHEAAFRAEESAHPRTIYIEKGGWAKLPGQTQPLPGLAKSCANALKASY